MDTKNILITFLKNKRAELGMTRQVFSEFLDIPFNTYKSYEIGKSIIKPQVMDHICEKLNIEPYEMLIPDNQKESRPREELFKPLKDEVERIFEKIPEIDNTPTEHWHKRKERYLTVAELNRIARIDEEIFKHRDIKTLFRALNRDDQDFFTDILINVQNDWCRGRVMAFYTLLKTSMIKPHWFKEEEEKAKVKDQQSKPKKLG